MTSKPKTRLFTFILTVLLTFIMTLSSIPVSAAENLPEKFGFELAGFWRYYIDRVADDEKMMIEVYTDVTGEELGVPAEDILHLPTHVGEKVLVVQLIKADILKLAEDERVTELELGGSLYHYTAESALRILRESVGLYATDNVTEYYGPTYDVNQDGEITPLDALEALRESVGLTTVYYNRPFPG